MTVAVARIQIGLMMIEIQVVARRRENGRELCLCKPLKGSGSAWIDRVDLIGYREIIRPCST